MRRLLIRFTVRRFMAAVAVVAVVLAGILWAGEMRRLSAVYGTKAVVHGRQERLMRQRMGWMGGRRGSPFEAHTLARRDAVAEHHRYWAGRYALAARRPWESVPPEPPAPTWETHRHKLGPSIVARATAGDDVNLGLRDAGITDDLLEQVGRCTRIQSLDLAGNPITDAGLVHLKGLKSLSRLVLSETRITDGGLASLAELSGLKTLDLDRTRITRQGLRTITKALPRTEVASDPDL